MRSSPHGSRSLVHLSVLGWSLLLLVPLAADADDADLRLGDRIRLRFADQRQAIEILTRHDAFVEALSPFDRQSRLQASAAVSTQRYLNFVSEQARAWEPAERARLSQLWESIGSRLEPYALPLPPEILLVRTTGREEADAAYCRRNAIVLPPKITDRSDDKLERLLVHELFHVLSSHNPDLRSRLYEIVGFHSCPPLTLPAGLQPRKITNPDAPRLDAYITLDLDGRSRHAIPVLYAEPPAYDAEKGQPFFAYLTFRLLVVEGDPTAFAPVRENGELMLLDPAKVRSYHKQIGGNTRYILHPDEILADNFVHLIFNTPDLPTPQIVAAMARVLGG